MKFSIVSMALLSQVLAAPIAAEAGLAKRAVVTVKNTNVIYVKNVVYVDQNGTPYKTEVVPYTTEAQIEQPTEAPAAPAPEAPAAAPTSEAAPAPAPSSEAPAPAPTPETPKSAEQPLPAPSPSPANFAADEKPEAAPSPSPAPEPTTSEAAPAPAPEPTTSEAPAPTTSEAAPEPSPSAPSTGGGSGDHTGEATFYDTGMGSCGITSTDSDFIVALNKDMWQAGMIDGNPNHNTLCGKKLTAHRGGKSVTVTVTDMCPGCASGDLDLSPAAFNALASPSEGRVGVSWSWN